MTEAGTYKKSINWNLVSDSNKNTIVVKVTRKFKDAVYSKFVNTSKKTTHMMNWQRQRLATMFQLLNSPIFKNEEMEVIKV